MISYSGNRKFLKLFLLVWLGCSIAGKAQMLTEVDTVRYLLDRAEDDSTRVSLLAILSNSYWDSDPDSAIKIAERGVELADQAGIDYGKSQCLFTMGVAYQVKGNYPVALNCLSESLALAKKINFIFNICLIYNAIGTIYMDLRDYGAAIKNLEYISDLAKDEELLGVYGTALANIGICQYSLANYEAAKETLKKSLEIIWENGNAD